MGCGTSGTQKIQLTIREETPKIAQEQESFSKESKDTTCSKIDQKVSEEEQPEKIPLQNIKPNNLDVHFFMFSMEKLPLGSRIQK